MDGQPQTFDLYPPIDPTTSGTLAVGNGHELYWEEAGNPDGTPVIFLHGGPGAGCAPVHRRFFDPAHYRVILFDQRGCGRSTPFCDLTNNTTQHLVRDIEALREHLGIEKWLVFGGSWGATLALAYGQAHPDPCLGFVLRGVFMGTQREMDWFLTGMRTLFPEAWNRFSAHVGETTAKGLLGAYHDRLNDPSPAVHNAAATEWAGYEVACSRLLPVDGMPGGPWALALARLEVHYFTNAMFFDDNQLMNGMARIDHLPAWIIQGRYDAVCPPVTAHALAENWQSATLNIIPNAGHAATEEGIRSALVRATETFKALNP